MNTGKDAEPLKWLELAVPPLLLCGGVMAVMGLLGYWGPVLDWPLPARVMPGAALFVLGTAVILIAAIQFRIRGTTVNPITPEATSTLIQTGIFARSRNPMYLGMILVLAGCAVCLGSVIAACLVPVFASYIHRFQIHPEERILTAKYGAVYTAYCRVVRRWI